MSFRVVLRSPSGDNLVRHVSAGVWAEATNTPAETLGDGLWALPGLVDAHAHLPGESLPLDGRPGDLAFATAQAKHALAAGVTLLFDKGWCDETTLDLIDSVPPGDRPEIEAAGRMLAVEGGYYPGFADEISADQLGEAVRRNGGGRARWVKLIGDWPRPGGPRANFDEGQLREAVETANSLGVRLAIHTMAPEVPSMAVAAGVHSIEHGLFLHDDDLDTLARVDGVWIPTVRRVEETIISLREGSSGQTLLRRGLENVRRMLPLAIEAGVTVLAGTDLAGPSAEVAREALMLASFGIPPAAVLEIVGRKGHQVAGRSGGFALGEPADAVFFSENPAEDLEVLAHPVHVMRLGRVL
ncbi:MAG: amidohydrolase family protein [Acidimicrobiia bacterium]